MRTIVIDEDTLIGYNYIEKLFYVENKGTTTSREDVEEIKKVLDIVAPNNEITIEQLVKMSKTLEEITDIYYTFADEGKFIKSVHFNEYIEYPIIMDCEIERLYVMNSEVVFDMSLSEGKKARVEILELYFRKKIGLNVNYTMLSHIYNLLVKYYHPYVYNKIIAVDRTSRLRYTYEATLSNFDKKAKAVYSLEQNPNAVFTQKTKAPIIRMEDSIIELIEPSVYIVGDLIKVKDSNMLIGTEIFTNDGSYIVDEVISDKEIKVTTPFVVTYNYSFPTVNIVSYMSYIKELRKEDNSITFLNSIPSGYQVGDTIVLKGAEVKTEYEEISADGTYTIVAILENNTILVDREIAISKDYSEETTRPTVHKRIKIGEVVSLSPTEKKIYVRHDLPPIVKTEMPISIVINETEIPYKVVAFSTSELWLKVDKEVPIYTPTYALLQVDIPSEEIQVDVTETPNPKVLPTGKFILDNKNECEQYLKLLNGITLPLDEVYDNMGNYVAEELELVNTMPPLKLLGFYSEIYKDETKK